MKKTIFLLPFALILILLPFGCSGPGKTDDETAKGEMCGQMIGYDQRIKNDTAFRNNMERLEQLTQEYIRKTENDETPGFRTTLITIPVVVHVVYKNAVENITNAQIQSQIDALNRDFRKMNADASTIPAAFQPVAADAFIEFTLAKRDPNCAATDGITRTPTTEPNFSTNNRVKHTSTNGKDAWNSKRYLNIWVCDLYSGLLGYGSWPADLAPDPGNDGIVMDYTAFGTTGTAAAPFNLGRVTAHEIGHWLNLRHIWGDESGCAGTDYVTDTPNQGPNNSGCPSYPHVTCSNGPNGDMFMNQMDYTSDACRRMFSAGQSDRMNATLYTVRYELLGSQGAIPPAGVTQDLWIKDSDADAGDETNNNSPIIYLSDDIWIRNTADGFTNQEHQNPTDNSLCHVYVRVRNRGCGISSGGTLKLYWAQASGGLGWPQPWDGTVTTPALMGHIIGSSAISPVNGNDFQIYHFTWTTPDPSDYISLGPDVGHFCLLARIETAATPPYGMTYPETGSLGANVKDNNNIAWKNIHIEDNGFAGVVVANYSGNGLRYSLKFNFLKNAARNLNVDVKNIFNEGTFEVRFNNELFKVVRSTGDSNITDMKYLEGTTYRITGFNAEVRRLLLEPYRGYKLGIRFTPNKDITKQRKAILLNMFQVNEATNEITGGQEIKFLLKGN